MGGREGGVTTRGDWLTSREINVGRTRRRYAALPPTFSLSRRAAACGVIEFSAGFDVRRFEKIFR